ncbi:MAG: nitroreductase family protein [Chitinispirillaceae bacterium]|nr:nitroreductase family protein [Chitinispirillaceae bacterium]
MKRRSFNKLMAAAGVTASVRSGWTKSLLTQASAPALPEVAMNGNSVEICTNSRYSFHGGYSATAMNQVLANTLWAAASAPLMATERIIYVALPDNLYTYKFEGGQHVLEVHASGNKRSESTAAFEIGVATTPAGATEDGGVALHWAQLASIAFWKTKTSQPASCPKETGRTNANSKWKPASEVHCVNCYGQIGSITGLVKTAVAVSSDKTLPDAKTDGTVGLEEAMKNPLFGTDFKTDDLTEEQISQILWASYGCTPHQASTKQGISVASHMMGYFLTGRIYVISSTGVRRYHMRKGSDEKTADHRLEPVSTDDCRAKLRTALSRLPQNAPVYIVYCGQKIEYKQLIEAGYCGGGALLQTTALGLQGHYCSQFTSAERSAVQTACGIPTAQLPMLIFSAGKPNGTPVDSERRMGLNRPAGLIAEPNPFSSSTALSFSIAAPATVAVRIFDAGGKLIRTLSEGRSVAGPVSIRWDGRDSRGTSVPPGMYTCRFAAAGHEESLLIRKI